MMDLSFLKQLDKLSLVINKKVTSNFYGGRESKVSGKGLLFKDYRIYAPGDDIRAVDWKVYGKTDHLYVKLFEEERNLTAHIIIDFSSSMNFGKKIKKYEYAAMLGIGFAYMALKNNERFVLSTFSDKLELFRAKKGRKQLVASIDYLNRKKPEGGSNFERSISPYKKAINSKSLIVIISDFLYDTKEIRNVVDKFKDHELILIQVLDEMESKLDLQGEFKLKDMESSSMLRTFISPFLRSKYLDNLGSHSAKIKKICDEVGARYFFVDTGTPIFDNFYRILR